MKKKSRWKGDFGILRGQIPDTRLMKKDKEAVKKKECKHKWKFSYKEDWPIAPFIYKTEEHYYCTKCLKRITK